MKVMTAISRSVGVLMAISVMALVGCSSVQQDAGEPVYRPSPTYPTGKAPTTSVPEVIRDTPKLHIPDDNARVETPTVAARGADAIDSLAVTASQDYSKGDYQSAIATAERGLRINRRSPDLYLVMAQSYMKLNQPDRARSFVEQGLRYAQPGTAVYESLQRVNDVVGF